MGEGFSEHGIFHGININGNCKSMKINTKNGSFTIEWEQEELVIY